MHWVGFVIEVNLKLVLHSEDSVSRLPFGRLVREHVTTVGTSTGCLIQTRARVSWAPDAEEHDR